MSQKTNMSSHRLQELAAASVAGGLSKKERSEFQRLLGTASKADKAEVASILNTGALAALGAPRTQAPTELFQKIIPRIIKGSLELNDNAVPGGLKFVLEAQSSGWFPIGVPGAYFKLLSIDDAKSYAVVLGKLDAGASYPPHKHIGPEEIYVLSGDLFIGEVKLSAGDFHTAAAGSHHAVNRSEDGCVILAIISKKDFAAQFNPR